jgi:hypothetical protein
MSDAANKSFYNKYKRDLLEHPDHKDWFRKRLSTDELEFVESSPKCLATLYEAVTDKGGFREVVAESKWRELKYTVRQNWP